MGVLSQDYGKTMVIMTMMMRGTYSFVLFCNPDSFLVIVQCLPTVTLEISLRCLHKKREIGGERRDGRGNGRMEQDTEYLSETLRIFQ